MLQKIEELEPGTSEISIISHREDRYVETLILGFLLTCLAMALEPILRGPLV